MMKTFSTLLALSFLAAASLAQPGIALADSKGCPPGLAKKNPPCVPPGQAKKGVTTHQWLHRDRIGDVVDRDDLIYLDDFVRYDLPPLSYGQRYAVVDNQIVVIDVGKLQGPAIDPCLYCVG